MITVRVVDPMGTEIVTFEGNADKTLIEQMEDKAFDMPFSCRAGACMTCALVVKGGKDVISQLIAQEHGGEKFIDTEDDTILSCIAGLNKEQVESEEQHTLTLELIDFY